MAAPDRHNNFSILRLLFASLVIVSHSFELIDGNRSREILTRCFGTISFGIFAVDGFFLVSGYLITASFLSSTVGSYIIKRVLRIYPGFIVAFITSLLLAEIVSFHEFQLPAQEIVHDLINLPFLLPPIAQNIYPGFPYPAADGPMWTIFYEFHCYLLIALLGLCGTFQRKWLLLAATAALLLHLFVFPDIQAPAAFPPQAADGAGFGRRLWLIGQSVSIGRVNEELRLAAIFLVGSCYFIFREMIPYKDRLAIAAAILTLGCMFSRHLAEPGLAIFGGYVILWFALHTKPLRVSAMFNNTDVSYGIYLYAWPIQKILIFYIHPISPYVLIIFTLLLSAIAAYLSWVFIEKPSLNLKTTWLLKRARPASAT